MSDILQHKHIVFGFEHYNPLGIVRSLGEYGIKPICIIVRGECSITSKSKYIGQLHLVESVEEGLEVLCEQYGDCENKPFVYTSDDQVTNLLDSKYQELKDKFFFNNAGNNNRIAEFQNKHRILEIAEQYGIPVLKTHVVDRGVIPDNLEYPIITKAIISTLDDWKKDMIICKNEQELKAAYEIIRSEKVLLQKYIEKKNELCLDGVSYNKGQNVAITIASTYNYVLPDNYSPYMTVDSFDNSELETKLQQMLREIAFEGIFSIEFLVDQDESLYFLEVNFRNSTWSYASTVAKMNLPVLWANGMINPNSTIVKTEIESPFCAMVEFDDFRNRVKGKQINALCWLGDFIKAKCKFYCASNDFYPVLDVVLNKIVRVKNKLFGHKK